MKLTFLGADREVTGSCTQVEAAGHRFLIDCGMEQGRDVYENADLPCAPGTYEALLLTHAHIDHSGLLPRLAVLGFRGPIYATPATIDLLEVLLLQKEVGLMRGTLDRDARADLIVVPLFETIEDLRNAAPIMRDFYALPGVAKLLQRRPRWMPRHLVKRAPPT